MLFRTDLNVPTSREDERIEQCFYKVWRKLTHEFSTQNFYKNSSKFNK